MRMGICALILFAVVIIYQIKQYRELENKKDKAICLLIIILMAVYEVVVIGILIRTMMIIS